MTAEEMLRLLKAFASLQLVVDGQAAHLIQLQAQIATLTAENAELSKRLENQADVKRPRTRRATSVTA